MKGSGKYGWIPDIPDKRDYKFKVTKEVLDQLPSVVNLNGECPDVFDQGALGSCTANAIGSAHQFEQMKQDHNKDFVPSRLFIYFNEREMEGSINSVSGAQIRNGIKSVVSQGACPEIIWPYNINKFRTKPSESCYQEAMLHQVVQYMRVDQTLNEMKGCLASGYPFVFGFTVYEKFESKEVASTGIVNMPTQSESSMGGHAVMAIGYDDATQRFLVRNSWGTTWGMKGNFTIPYAYLTDGDLAADFWTIRLVEVSDQSIPEPTPIPPSKNICDLLFPAAKMFVDGALYKADTMRGSDFTPDVNHMFEAGLRNLQKFLTKSEKIRKI